MKCPNCKLVCSDSAEKCPKCKHDLAPLKLNIGLSPAPRVSIKSKKPQESETAPAAAPIVERQVAPIFDPNWQPPAVLSFGQLSTAEKVELREFFKTAEAELPSTEDEISLGAEQLLSVHNRDDIRVVFDIADEAFENPEIERLLEAGLIGSDGVRADGIELASALKKAQREMDAPFTLAAMSKARHAETANDGSLFKKTRRVVPAEAGRVLIAGVIDQCGVVALGALVVTLLWPDIIGGFRDLPDFALLSLLTSLMFFVIILQSGYWLLAYFIAGRTVGEFLTGLKVVNRRGGSPGRSLFFVRALSAPVGRAAQVFGGTEPLHCRLSGTVLTRNRKLGRAA